MVTRLTVYRRPQVLIVACAVQFLVSIDTLCAELGSCEVRQVGVGNDDARELTTEHIESVLNEASLLYKVPGGNQVGGLPPALSSNTGAVSASWPPGRKRT